MQQLLDWIEQVDKQLEERSSETIENIEKLMGMRDDLEKKDRAGCPLLQPARIGLIFNLGFAYDQLEGNLEKSIELHQQVLQLNPKHDSSLYSIGTNLAKLGRYREAEPYLQKAVEINSLNEHYQRNYNHVWKCVHQRDNRLLFADAIKYRRLREK